jgi:hypothetical protein
VKNPPIQSQGKSKSMGNIVDRIGDFIVSQGRRRSSNSDDLTSYTYTFPTKNGTSFFSSHFIMGGERFETYQPEAFLFGENLDLNFLGSRPTPFPYAAPCPNEPTRCLSSLLNIRKESIRLIRVTDPDLVPKPIDHSNNSHAIVIGSSDDDCKKNKSDSSHPLTTTTPASNPNNGSSNNTEKEYYHYNIEFVFDTDVSCAIRIYYFCHEEISSNGINYVPRDWDICSDKVIFARGAGQSFSQSRHIFTPSNYADCDLNYSAFDEAGFFDPKVPFPIVIQMTALEGVEPRQSNTLIAIMERNTNGSYSLKPFVQKLFIDGLSYLMQEIYGIENKTIISSVSDSSNKFMSPEEQEDECNSAAECVVCLSDPRDTLILPCRHLCLCYACADSLRYQANNCPICRAPFRALLQIRAVRFRSNTGHECNNVSIMDPHSPVPAGYESLPLIEAVNGPFPVSRSTLAPDIDRTPVSVRRSHRRHNKHSSSSHNHHHHSSSSHHHHHHDHRSDQFRVAAQQPVLQAPQQLQQVHHSSFNKLNTPIAHNPAVVLTQETIQLPTRRIITNPIVTSSEVVNASSSVAAATTTGAAMISSSPTMDKIPPDPAPIDHSLTPIDWKLMPVTRMIRRKQSDEETSSSASSGIIPQETTRLLTESSGEPVEFLQRSASTKSNSRHRTAENSYSDAYNVVTGSGSSPKLTMRENIMHHGISPANLSSSYAPVHPHDMMLMTSAMTAAGSDSLSSSSAAASPRDSINGGNPVVNPVTGTDDEADVDDDDEEDDDICHDFSKVLRVRGNYLSCKRGL